MGPQRSPMPINGGYSARVSSFRGNFEGLAALCALGQQEETWSVFVALDGAI